MRFKFGKVANRQCTNGNWNTYGVKSIRAWFSIQLENLNKFVGEQNDCRANADAC